MTSQHSTDVSPNLNGSGGLATATIIDNSRLWPILVVACVLGAIGFVAGIGAAGYAVRAELTWDQSYRELERENRLAQLKIDEFRMALMKAGIDPNPHLEGESQ